MGEEKDPRKFSGEEPTSEVTGAGFAPEEPAEHPTRPLEAPTSDVSPLNTDSRSASLGIDDTARFTQAGEEVVPSSDQGRQLISLNIFQTASRLESSLADLPPNTTPRQHLANLLANRGIFDVKDARNKNTSFQQAAERVVKSGYYQKTQEVSATLRSMHSSPDQRSLEHVKHQLESLGYSFLGQVPSNTYQEGDVLIYAFSDKQDPQFAWPFHLAVVATTTEKIVNKPGWQPGLAVSQIVEKKNIANTQTPDDSIYAGTDFVHHYWSVPQFFGDVIYVARKKT